MPYRTTHTRRRAAVLACLVVLSGACSSSSDRPAPAAPSLPAVSALPSAATVASLRPLVPTRYAAVGDSYAAGEGLIPFEPDSGPCHRSASAYPRLVAAQQSSA